jgi:hypothetical protein
LLSEKNEQKVCKNLNLIALAIDENFSALFNIFSLSPLG